MTITFPRALPNNAKMQECWFDLPDNIVASPSAKGLFVNLSEVNDPVWKGTFRTGILSRDDAAIWSAWHKSLRGGLRQFVAYDVRKSRPRAYPTANAPADIEGGWDGTATVTTLGASGALSLADLPLTYQFKIGDRVGLEQAGKYGYYEILEDVAAVGGVATITVQPFLHTGLFDTDAVCRVWRPLCQFIVMNWAEQGTVEPSASTFEGAQRF